MWSNVYVTFCQYVSVSLCQYCHLHICSNCVCHFVSVILSVLFCQCHFLSVILSCNVIMSNVIWPLTCYGQLVVDCLHMWVNTRLVLWSGHLRFYVTYLRLSSHFLSICGLGCLLFSSENVNSCVWGYESLCSQDVPCEARSLCAVWGLLAALVMILTC